MFELPHEDESTRQPRTFTIPIPFLRDTVGAGDLVKSLTDALRIPQCGGCQERQERMNSTLGFRPMRLWED
jgi:hypothetical protein